MIAECPRDGTHKQFQTIAHVTEEWLVDEVGDFIEVIGSSIEVAHWPQADDLWFCNECGEEAIVTS